MTWLLINNQWRGQFKWVPVFIAPWQVSVVFQLWQAALRLAVVELLLVLPVLAV
jgi:hypothetical protein